MNYVEERISNLLNPPYVLRITASPKGHLISCSDNVIEVRVSNNMLPKDTTWETIKRNKDGVFDIGEYSYFKPVILSDCVEVT